jgi:hypothetical protein
VWERARRPDILSDFGQLLFKFFWIQQVLHPSRRADRWSASLQHPTSRDWFGFAEIITPLTNRARKLRLSACLVRMGGQFFVTPFTSRLNKTHGQKGNLSRVFVMLHSSHKRGHDSVRILTLL